MKKDPTWVEGQPNVDLNAEEVARVLPHLAET